MHLSNDCQIVRSALVSGPPNRKKPYNKHLISLVFSVRTANCGSSFFSIDLCNARALHSWAISRWKKNRSVIYSYGPKTRLIRGIFSLSTLDVISTVVTHFLSPAIGNNSNWALCWQTSTHGWAASTFHSRCDGKNHTITVIRKDQYVFGGCTDIPWCK